MNSNLVHALILVERLGHCVYDRFERTGERQDLDWTIALERLLLDFCPSYFPGRWVRLRNLALLHSIRYDRWRYSADLEKAIVLWREAISRGHEDRPNLLENLAGSLWDRFQVQGKVEDLDEAILLRRSALTLFSEDHTNRPASLCNLAIFLATRFEQTGNAADLSESIVIYRAVLSFHPEGHSERASTLNNLANALQTRFEQNGNEDDLNDAIQLHRDALDLCPAGHPDLPSFLGNLGGALIVRFRMYGRADDLNESINLWHDALSLLPDGHPNRSGSLSNLAEGLHARFKQVGDVDDLNAAVQLHHDALALRPQGHPDRSSSLSNLANSLSARFEHCGTVDDLNEAVQLCRDALALLLEGHPSRPSFLNNLATNLSTRSEYRGCMDDLNEAVQLNRDALALRPKGHPSRSSSLSSLACSLWTRFRWIGNVHDLDEAVQLCRDALTLLPGGHLLWPSLLNNLSISLSTRFERNGSVDDLNEAVQLNRNALALRPEGHPSCSSFLSNLANSLLTRFEQLGNVDDLDEAIQLHRDALVLCPEEHLQRSLSLNGLAGSLQARFEQIESIDDLSEAVRLLRDALALLPEGRPGRSSSMFNISGALHARFEKLGYAEDFEECIRLLMGAADDRFSSILGRLDAANRWTMYARRRDHTTTLDAYRTAISLLQLSLTVRPNLSERHEALTRKRLYQTLGVDAASYAIEKGALGAAVELLEEGRALLWSGLRGLRSPLDRLSAVDKGLVDRFAVCCRQLERLMTSSDSGRSVLDTSGEGVHGPKTSKSRNIRDEMLERVRKLTEEQEAIINKIRLVPGFEDFLRCASFEMLRQVASEGPVIVLNHSEFRCDALIILSREVEPCICVPLDGDWFSDALDLRNDLVLSRYKHGVDSLEYDEMLRRAMKVLWNRVVSKVVRKLEDSGIAKGSRIWWCPTLFLSALPFHAAGPYEGMDGVRKYLIDDYISSYTPTLTSPIAARTGIRIGMEKFLFVGDTSLKATKKELSEIRNLRRVGKILLDDKASGDKVLAALKDREWVHFACHGALNSGRPFESSFVLPGGKLTLLDIAKANLPNAEFAFLSACHTAEQPARIALDEALNLAAAIQFCGFRSVVGTMWQLLDKDGPILSKAVYLHLRDVGEGEMRFKKAAAAVREAAIYLRSRTVFAFEGEEDVKAWRWVNLVHIGA